MRFAYLTTALVATLAGPALAGPLNSPRATGESLGHYSPRLDRDNAVMLFVDHQTGLANLVRDINPTEFNNVINAVADMTKLYNLPAVLTTSMDHGPNGPFEPSIRNKFPDSPFIARPGEINAFDNPDFVKAVQATGKKQVIIAGIVTDVCVTFAALGAIEMGYEVFVITDASGTFNEMARYASWMRMASKGIQLMNWFEVACELGRDWRDNMDGMSKLFGTYIPEYRNLIISHSSAQTNNTVGVDPFAQ